MRVLLIVPPFADLYGQYRSLYRAGFVNPPLGLCYLAASMEKAGHVVRILDAEAENLSPQEVINRASEFCPDLIGLGATSPEFPRVVSLVSALKSQWSTAPIVVGGTHLSIFQKKVLQENPEIDFGIVGDGENTLVELTENIFKQHALYRIKGLIYRENGTDEIVQNELRSAEYQLDYYPFPARGLLKNDKYYRAVPKKGYVTTASVMSSRGCPYKCIYCAVDKIHGGSLARFRSSQNVLEELEYIVKEMGINHVAFNDDCLTLKKKRMYDICEGIKKRGLKFTWEGLSRADLVDRELLDEMKRAGLVRISYGIESGNSKILEILQKGESLEKIEYAFKITKEAGIVTRGSVLLGAPYETKETVKDTFRFIKKLRGLDQVAINVLQPYPGTKVRDMIIKGEGGTKFVEDKNNFENLKRFGSASISVNNLSPEDLILLQKKGFMGFYLRPKVIWNNFKITGLRAFLQDGFNFLRSVTGF